MKCLSKMLSFFPPASAVKDKRAVDWVDNHRWGIDPKGVGGIKKTVESASASDPSPPLVQSIKTIKVKNVNGPTVKVHLPEGPWPPPHPCDAHSHAPYLLGQGYKAGHQKLICSVSVPD